MEIVGGSFGGTFLGGATLPECRPPPKSLNFREWGRPRDLSPRSTPCLRLGVIEETISEALGMHFDNRSANSELVFGAR